MKDVTDENLVGDPVRLGDADVPGDTGGRPPLPVPVPDNDLYKHIVCAAWYLEYDDDNFSSYTDDDHRFNLNAAIDHLSAAIDILDGRTLDDGRVNPQ